MAESWLLRKRVEARILAAEFAEAFGGGQRDEAIRDDDDWESAGFEVERRAEGDFGRTHS